MNRLINISGGAIKLIGLISCFRKLVRSGVKPQYVSGISAGAIIAFCYACGRLDEAFKMAKKSYNRRVIFSKGNDPVGKISGLSLSAIIKIARGKNYMGVMDNLEKNIRSIVTPDDFLKYKLTYNTPRLYISVIDETDGQPKLVDIKEENYENAMSYVIASASIAPTIKAREINSVMYNDGGHRDSSAGGAVLGLKGLDIDECITIWSRPSEEVYRKEKIKSVSNFMKRLTNFTIGVFLRESSLNDEYKERTECNKLGIVYSPIYLESFASSTFDITKEEILKGVSVGQAAADDYIRINK